MKCIDELVSIMAQLRSADGCPWDQVQTHQSLRRHLVEEAYEVVEAIAAEDPQNLREELGDLLLQVIFHAQIAQESGQFTLEDVVQQLTAKLVRRHPHVFDEVDASSVSDVIRNWNAIKADEKRRSRTDEHGHSLMHDMPQHIPALLLAEEAQKRSAKVGFEWDSVSGALDKFMEEMQEFTTACASNQQQQAEEELGDILFSLVNISRYLDISAELSLRLATEKFVARFRELERRAAERGSALEQMTLEEMDSLWDEVKVQLRSKPQR